MNTHVMHYLASNIQYKQVQDKHKPKLCSSASFDTPHAHRYLNMLSPSTAATRTAFVLPSSSSTWVRPFSSSISSSSSSSPVAPSFNALYLRPLPMPLLQQQQQQLQQHKTRGRALAFWQRQAEEEVVVRVGREGGEGGMCVGGGGHLCEG